MKPYITREISCICGRNTPLVGKMIVTWTVEKFNFYNGFLDILTYTIALREKWILFFIVAVLFGYAKPTWLKIEGISEGVKIRFCVYIISI